MGIHPLLGLWSTKTVLCFEKMLNQKDLPTHSESLHALLYSHLVRRLDLLRMLPWRQMQLLCHCEFYTTTEKQYFFILKLIPFQSGDRSLKFSISMLMAALSLVAFNKLL